MAMFRTPLFKTGLVRLSYAQGLLVPRQAVRDDGSVHDKWDCNLIIPRSDAQGMAVIQKAVAEAIKGQWGDQGIELFKRELIKSPILKGDGKEAHNKKGELRPGLGADVVFIRPSSGRAPKLFSNRAVKDSSGRVTVAPATPDEVQSGYWGYAVLNAYCWENPKNGKGVSFGLDMVQIVKEDARLGGGDVDPMSFFADSIQTDQKGDLGDASDIFA